MEGSSHCDRGCGQRARVDEQQREYALLRAALVYVPRCRRADLGMAIGAGVVGTEDGDELALYYEDQRDALPRWADRVHHAWGRWTFRAPTTRRRRVPLVGWQVVGAYNPIEGEIAMFATAREAVTSWLGEFGLDGAELQTSTSAKHQQRREIRAFFESDGARHGTPHWRFMERWARSFGHDDPVDREL